MKSMQQKYDDLIKLDRHNKRLGIGIIITLGLMVTILSIYCSYDFAITNGYITP